MKNSVRRYTCTLLLIMFSLWLPVMPAQAQDVVPEGFETWIEEGMEQWDIPGMAIAIVKDGDLAYARGFGVRKLGETETVDEHTQFGIASVSKHMTASSLALLVDEGLIGWDDKVIDHIPWFKLSDPWATENVTIRDLLTHQVGIGRILGNRLQFMTNRSRKQLLYRMRYHDFEQPFRAGYVYSNVMYTLAGEIVGAVTGQSWDEFMAERFFRPMGMERTNTSIDNLHEDGNAAWPHQYIEGDVIPIPGRNWDIAAPAGGVNSTAIDMGKWMLMQLGTPGQLEETQIISTRSVQEIQTPQVSLNISDIEAPQRSYGLGFTITDYRNFRVLTHGGATDGMNTTFMLVPGLEFGIIIMTNTFNLFREAVAWTALDHLIGEPGTDWHTHYYESYTNQYERVKQLRDAFEATQLPDTSPTHPPDSYTGSYHNDLYDDAEVRLEGDNLVLQLWDDESLTADLEHWHHNTFRINWRNPAQREEFLQFHMNLEGEIDAMEIRFTLRPMLLQVGAYPTNYYRDARYQRVDGQ